MFTSNPDPGVDLLFSVPEPDTQYLYLSNQGPGNCRLHFPASSGANSRFVL